MKTISRYLLTLVALFAMTAGAWADETATITLKCGSTVKTYEDVTLPWSTTENILKEVISDYKNVASNIDAITGGDGKVVKYGNEQFTVTGTFSGEATVVVSWYNSSKRSATITVTAPGPLLTLNEAKTEATMESMPNSDVTVNYELVRDIDYGVGVTVNGEPTWGEGDDSPRFLVKKNGEGKYQPETPFVFELKDLFLDQNNPPVLAQSDYTLLKRQRLDEDGTTWNDLAETDDYQPGIYCIAFIATETSAYDGTVFSGEFEIYAKNITVDPVAATGLVYNGQPQALASEAECEGGEMRYSLDGETWSAQMPTVTDAGTYTLYYKVVTGDNDPDTDYKKIENIVVAKAELSSVTLEKSMLMYDTFGHQPRTVVITTVNAGEVEVPATEYTIEGDTYTDMGDYTVTVTANETSVNFTGQATAYWFILIEPILLDNDEGILIVTADPETQTLTIDNIVALETVHIPAEINGFQVTAIGPGALSPEAGVTDIYLPDTEEPIDIAEGALPEDVTIHTSLALLDDYALMNGLKPNYEGRRVMTTVTPKNRLWTLSSGVDIILPDGVTPNRVETIDNGNACTDIITDEQLDMDGEKVLKACNGVLMQSEAGASFDLVARPGRQASGSAVCTDDVKDYGKNLLEAVVESKHVAPNAYYILKSNKFVALEGDDETMTPACKAVLKSPANVNLARVLNISGDAVTAVFDLNDNGEMINDNWYDLNGRKLDAAPTKKGLYIKNGRKVVVK